MEIEKVENQAKDEIQAFQKRRMSVFGTKTNSKTKIVTLIFEDNFYNSQR